MQFTTAALAVLGLAVHQAAAASGGPCGAYQAYASFNTVPLPYGAGSAPASYVGVTLAQCVANVKASSAFFGMYVPATKICLEYGHNVNPSAYLGDEVGPTVAAPYCLITPSA